jgi:hypothetical protein
MLAMEQARAGALADARAFRPVIHQRGIGADQQDRVGLLDAPDHRD